MMLDLKDIVDDLESETNIKALIITGKGDKAFCAGSDLRKFILHQMVSTELRTLKFLITPN